METSWAHNEKQTPSRFKSYYVVWKPVKENNRCNTTISLNRTMQYGNENGIHHWRRNADSLNRTMQYGNQAGRGRGYRHIHGLNRTMQYGNP